MTVRKLEDAADNAEVGCGMFMLLGCIFALAWGAQHKLEKLECRVAHLERNVKALQVCAQNGVTP